MSATGLYSGTYPAIRDFAELLDAVLILLKAQTFDPADERIKRLGQALMCYGAPAPSTPVDQLIGSVIATSCGTSDMRRVVELGSALVAGKTTTATVDQLESIAASLEMERASTFAKMRGR